MHPAPIFEDADTFPCIIVAKKVLKEAVIPKRSPVLICPVPRNKLKDINLSQYVDQEGFSVEWSRFSEQAWSLESPQVDLLMQKIKNRGIPLKEFTGVKPYRGILTGFNEAFCINEETKNKLIQADPKCAEIIKPYLRGQDIKRWSPEWQNLWMIFTRRGIDIDAYPEIKKRLNKYRKQLEPCPKNWNKDQDGQWLGRKSGFYKWYEIPDSVDYWNLFEQPKIIYQEINTLPSYCIDTDNYFANNKVFLLPTSDYFLLGCLNSPLGWWIAHRIFPKMMADAVTPRGDLMINFPVANPRTDIKLEIEELTTQLITLTKTNQQTYRDISDWLKSEQNIDKLGQKLEKFNQLSQEDFIKEIKKRKPKSERALNVTALRAVKEVYNEYTPIINARQIEAQKLEHRLSDLVNQAYQLAPEEIDLMWRTAPPRMPISAPEN